MNCPKCGSSNSDAAEFCTHCHAILIHRCPKCWHEQRSGNICERCGTNFALYWELAFEQSMKDADRLSWDRLKTGVSVYLQILLLPFTSLHGLIRILLARMIFSRFPSR